MRLVRPPRGIPARQRRLGGEQVEDTCRLIFLHDTKPGPDELEDSLDLDKTEQLPAVDRKVAVLLIEWPIPIASSRHVGKPYQDLRSAALRGLSDRRLGNEMTDVAAMLQKTYASLAIPQPCHPGIALVGRPLLPRDRPDRCNAYNGLQLKTLDAAQPGRDDVEQCRHLASTRDDPPIQRLAPLEQLRTLDRSQTSCLTEPNEYFWDALDAGLVDPRVRLLRRAVARAGQVRRPFPIPEAGRPRELGAIHTSICGTILRRRKIRSACSAHGPRLARLLAFWPPGIPRRRARVQVWWNTPPVRVPVLLITGPVGVGKTSVFAEIEDLLQNAGMRFAAVELDALSYCHPRQRGDDRFRTKLTFRNLAAVWQNFQAAGAERLVLSCVVESRRELARYRRAVPGADIVVVRLTARDVTLRSRVRRREIGLGREWHERRATELARIMERARVEDLVVDTDRRTVHAIAREILDRTGWMPTRGGDQARGQRAERPARPRRS